MSVRQVNTPQVKRFACDRCHDQKLRCPRPVDGGSATVPCIRCQRAGTVCNISSPLKTGRPSKALKLQGRTEQHSSSISPPLSRTSSNNTNNDLMPANSGAIVPDYSPENETYSFQESDSTFLNYASNVSPHHGSFQICGQDPAPSVVEENSRHLNFGLGITNPMDMNSSGTTRGKDMCELRPCRYQDTRNQSSCANPADLGECSLPQYYPTTKSTSADLTSYPTHNALALDPFLYNTDTGVNVDILQDCMTKNDLNYDTQFSPYHILVDTVSAEEPCKSEPVCQGPCCLRPDMVNRLGDQRSIWPSLDCNASHQDATSINIHHRSSESRSPSTLSDSDCGMATGQTEEVQWTQSLLQLQMEIYECSATIVLAGTTPEADVEACQKESGASRQLFNATERFIRLISGVQIPSIFVSQPQQPVRVDTSVPGVTRTSPYSLKRGACSPTLDGSYSDAILDASGTRSGAGSSNTAFFHLMMGCYTRLLTAYETVVERYGNQLCDTSRPARRPSTASLSSTLATDNDPLVRSQMQLHGISHQLSKLNNAVRAALMSSQCQRQPERYSQRFSPGSLHQARRSPSPTMLEESAIEVVEEQERVLQAKIEKLKSFFNNPRHAKRTRSRLNA